MEKIVTKEIVGRVGNKNLVLKKPQYRFCDDIWNNIKEYVGVSNQYPIDLIKTMEKTGLDKLKKIYSKITHYRITGNSNAKNMKEFLIKCFFKFVKIQKNPQLYLTMYENIEPISKMQWQPPSDLEIDEEIKVCRGRYDVPLIGKVVQINEFSFVVGLYDFTIDEIKDDLLFRNQMYGEVNVFYDRDSIIKKIIVKSECYYRRKKEDWIFRNPTIPRDYGR